MFVRFVNKMFGKYESGYECWVMLKEIDISPQFKSATPRPEKISRKWDYYCMTGKFESPIILTQDFIPKDGYTSYLIAREQGLDKVPVYFID